MTDDGLVHPDSSSDRDSELGDERLEKRPEKPAAKKRVASGKRKLGRGKSEAAVRPVALESPAPGPTLSDPRIQELLESDFFKSGAWKNEVKKAQIKAAPPMKRKVRVQKSDAKKAAPSATEPPRCRSPDFYSSVMIV